jgi:hypothetical protein
MVTDVAEKVYSKNQNPADGPILANSVVPIKVVAVVSNWPPNAKAFPNRKRRSCRRKVTLDLNHFE